MVFAYTTTTITKNSIFLTPENDLTTRKENSLLSHWLI